MVRPSYTLTTLYIYYIYYTTLSHPTRVITRVYLGLCRVRVKRERFFSARGKRSPLTQLGFLSAIVSTGDGSQPSLTRPIPKAPSLPSAGSPTLSTGELPMFKTAILQVADTGPLESLVVMLYSAGYASYLPGPRVRDYLIQLGCDTVLSPRDLTASLGYETPRIDGREIPEVTMPELGRSGRIALGHCDLYVDVKAHRNYAPVVKAYPSLSGKVLWYRINGGKPERVPGCGDEIDPPCPVLTPNLWYSEPGPWDNRSYACWPPFYRFDEYSEKYGRPTSLAGYSDPICLIHNLQGWGYGRLVASFASLGVKMFGRGSPHGLITHTSAAVRLRTALAMVHLKSSDAPGYALYEALAAGCPIVCTRRLIWRNRMQGLLIPGETCLVFDRETHDGLTDEDVTNCTTEVSAHLDALRNPEYNRKIGLAGHERLRELMWNRERDGDSFRAFMTKVFP